MDQLREKLAAAEKRARSLKTKKAQTKAWDRVREIRREIVDELYNASKRFAKHAVKARVKYFSPGSEHYLVETAEYGSLWLNPTADVLTKSWYAHTCCIEYTEGQEIVVEIDVEVNHDRLCLNIVPSHVTGGRVNEAQYAELCKRDDLAFFKYPTGHMSGLFK